MRIQILILGLKGLRLVAFEENGRLEHNVNLVSFFSREVKSRRFSRQ